MALISCPECGKEISDKAPSCPSCGVPIAAQVALATEGAQPAPQQVVTVNAKRSGGTWEGIGFLLIVIGMIIGMASGDDNHIGGFMGLVGFVLFIIGRFK